MRKINNLIGRSSNATNEEMSNLEIKQNIILKLGNKLSNLNKTVHTSKRQTLSRILYYNEIYKNIVGKPGSIMEFGVEFGATLSLLIKLRGIYEPYNYSRKIIGFDTFEGFTENLEEYEKIAGWKKSDYKTPKNYKDILEQLLLLEEKDCPVSHIKKFELIKGDASLTVKDYLSKNKQTVISLAIFDMDVYQPTKNVILAIKDRLFKGSVLVFDEINHPEFAGETVALLETMGLKNLKLKSFHGETFGSYAILD
jgi:hypothetical protein